MSFAPLFIVLIPFLGAFFILFLSPKAESTVKGIFLAACLGTFFLVAYLGFRLIEREFFLTMALKWMPALGSDFVLRLDPVTYFFCFFSALVYGVFGIFFYRFPMERMKEFLCLILLAQSGILGLFMSGDAVLFYFFWEAVLIPFYFILLIWGKSEQSPGVAMKYIGYTVFGSLLLLVGLIYMANEYYREFGTLSFVFEDWRKMNFSGAPAYYLFWAFILAFLIKTPVFPFHTWQPDTYQVLPTSSVVLMASLFSKVGLFGIFQLVMVFFPEIFKLYSFFFSLLAVAGILYGGMMAFAQNNLKRILAYSSISHLGFALLGLFSFTHAGIQGALFIMFSHILVTAGLFLALAVLEKKFGHLNVNDFGGIIGQAPVFAGFFVFLVLASIGLPGLSGFVGEFLALKGAFEPHPWLAGFAALGVILSACYLLRPFQKIFLGPLESKTQNGDKILAKSQGTAFIPLIFCIIVLGVFPMGILNLIEQQIQNLVSLFL